MEKLNYQKLPTKRLTNSLIILLFTTKRNFL